MDVILQNIVCTVDVGTSLDLERVATESRNVEYNPRKFAAVIMRLMSPKTTALIFATGKIVCTGAKDVAQAQVATREYSRILGDLGFPVTYGQFSIQNVVGSCDAGHSIRVEGIRFEHPEQSTYEPEVFPGLIYRMTDPYVVILVFVSGKVVFTGAKSVSDINLASWRMQQIISQYQKVLH